MEDPKTPLSETERALFEDLERQLARRPRWKLLALAVVSMAAVLAACFFFWSIPALVVSAFLFMVAAVSLTVFFENLPTQEFRFEMLKKLRDRPSR